MNNNIFISKTAIPLASTVWPIPLYIIRTVNIKKFGKHFHNVNLNWCQINHAISRTTGTCVDAAVAEGSCHVICINFQVEISSNNGYGNRSLQEYCETLDKIFEYFE